MDVNENPEFPELYAGIKRRFGPEWAKRFVMLAPLLIDDPDGPVYRAFLDGLRSHSAGARTSEARAWARCQSLVRDLGASLVAEAESILTSS
jgi:hypothetical protein